MEEIKAIRKSKGWTQKIFAEYLGIPLITYVQWENGSRNPPSYVLELIKYKCRTDTKQIKIKIVYLLWSNNHIYEEQTLLGIYEEYNKALESLKNIQCEYYADEIELYISEKKII